MLIIFQALNLKPNQASLFTSSGMRKSVYFSRGDNFHKCAKFQGCCKSTKLNTSLGQMMF